MKKNIIANDMSKEKKQELRKEINKTLGIQLSKARTSPPNDYSLYEVAGLLGTSYSHIARIESGIGNTYFADVKLLADILGVSIDSLCKDGQLVISENESPWLDVPPILAFLSILNRFQPDIELGEKSNQPIVKLSFNFNHLLDQKERFKEFFTQYKVIDTLIKGDIECAEEVDILTHRLIKKYSDLNT